jgi:hypothetical protein
MFGPSLLGNHLLLGTNSSLEDILVLCTKSSCETHPLGNHVNLLPRIQYPRDPSTNLPSFQPSRGPTSWKTNLTRDRPPKGTTFQETNLLGFQPPMRLTFLGTNLPRFNLPGTSFYRTPLGNLLVLCSFKLP